MLHFFTMFSTSYCVSLEFPSCRVQVNTLFVCIVGLVKNLFQEMENDHILFIFNFSYNFEQKQINE
jgi:hypothetical protein